MPGEERLSLREAAALFDPPKTKKALEQLVQRGALQVERETGAGGRTTSVWTTRKALEEYEASTGGRARLRSNGPEFAWAEPAGGKRAPARKQGRPQRQPVPDYWRGVVEDLVRENADLRLRVAELEARGSRRPGT